jgi:hypothetical protein
VLAPLADNVVVLPLQIVVLVLLTAKVGVAFTVTLLIAELVLVQPAVLVPTTV